MNMSHKAESLLYQPLQHQDSFRLLELKSSAFEGEWTAALIEARLPREGCAVDAPKYVALSYVCGDPTFAVPYEDTIEIRCSVSTALGHLLQSASGTLTIWIDQFCINQGDVKEKEQQINMMGRIFAGAEEVIGWLGPPFMGSEETFEDLAIFAGVPPEAPEADKDHYAQLVTARIANNLFGEEIFSYIGQITQLGSGLRIRMKHLFNLPWFNRRWIAQEVCLASKLQVYCGNYSISGEQLFRAIDVIQNTIVHGALASLNRPLRNAYALLQMRNKVQEAARRDSCLSFAHIIQALSHLDCDKDQDRINALLGMVPSNALWLSADYRPAPELFFVDFALRHMQHFKSIEILHFAGVVNTEEIKLVGSEVNVIQPARDLPSWAPDWRIRRRPLPMTSMDKGTLNCNITLLLNQVVYDSSRMTLTLRGKLLNTRVGPCMPHLDWFNLEESPQYQHATDLWSNNTFLSYLHALDPWLAEQYRYSPSFAHWFSTVVSAGNAPYSILLCFARTLIMDSTVRSTERPDLTVPQDQIMDYFIEYAKLRLVVDPEATSIAFDSMADDHKSMEKVAAYGYLAEHICRYRAVFVGDDGVVGLGAARISPGDRICFFSGLETPFIVHPEGDRFELRGECYVDGMMDIPCDELGIAESQIVLA
jgi:hypothetical protein